MSPDVLVIGGGVSGLCAAVDCASRGHSVVLAEQSPHLGGRVYSFPDAVTGDDIDNGQHLLLGCYHSTLRYLRTVGTIDRLSLQPSLELYFRSTSARYRLRAPMLPAPLHVFGALLGLGSLSIADRLSILRIVPSLLSADPDTDAGLRSMTVDDWLSSKGQSERTKTNLWNILSIGTLNERPDRASASLFVRVLQTVFLGSRSDASLALPRAGLSRLFADGGAEYLSSRGAKILLNTRIGDVQVNNGCVESAMAGSVRITPRAVICAVPFHAIGRTFADGSRAALPLLGQTGRFSAVPIVSIHLWYDRPFMEEDFTALLGSRIDWVFNKSAGASVGTDTTGNPERWMHLSLVISAARTESARPKEDIAAMAHAEMLRYFPQAVSARLMHWLVIKEKRATFSPGVGIEASRPPHATPIGNLFIAGDWTDTRLPATIEGAAQSGYACAALADMALRAGLQG